MVNYQHLQLVIIIMEYLLKIMLILDLIVLIQKKENIFILDYPLILLLNVMDLKQMKIQFPELLVVGLYIQVLDY